MVVELRKQLCREFYMKYLRSIGRFYGVNLPSKSANSILRTDCPFWRDYFENRFFLFFNGDHKKSIKFYRELNQLK